LEFQSYNFKDSIMKNLILVFLSCCIANSSFSQSLVKEFNIYFGTNSSQISSDGLEVLKTNFDELTNLMIAYQIDISGYTDATGDATINKKLSRNRARAVTKYMVSRGISKSQIKTQYFGSNNSIASNATERGKAINRRTNIKISTKKQVPNSIGGYQLKPQEYSFTCDSTIKIRTASGSEFTIPKHAFIDDKGNVVEGEVKLEVTEYNDPLDFVFANEPMNLEQDGQLAFYQSDGMFKLEAKQGNKELSLAPGKSIKSDIKLKRNQTESRFYSFNSDSGQWNNGQSINQNTLTLGHDEKFSNSEMCREAMVAFELNLNYTDGKKISPYYHASIKRGKDDVTIIPIYSLKNTETKLYERLDNKVSGLERKLKQKEHRYVFKNKETIAGKVSFDLELHKKSSNKRKNETKYLSGLSLQVKRKELKSKKRKLAFRKKNQLKNVRLVKTDSGFILRYTVRIEKKIKGRIDITEFKDSLKNIRLVNKGLISKITGGRNKKRSFENYKRGLNKYDEVIFNIEDRLSKTIVRRDSVNQIITVYNDTIESSEFLQKIEKFTSFGQNKLLTTSEEAKWLFDFDENQNIMNTTIDSILATNQYSNCSFRNNKFMREQSRQNKLQKVLAGSGLGVDLTSMGTYNADAIKRLKNPDLIVANYEDKEGNAIDITVIYVFDRTLNGVMRFDGYMNRSPYKFEISRENAKSLIAFDDKMNAYMIPNDTFRKRIQSDKVVFVLEPFKKATSKEHITQQMAI